MTRLSVNINDDTADILRELRRRFGWSATEAVRQPAGLGSMALDVVVGQDRLLIDRGETMFEVVLVDWKIRS